MTTNLQTGMIRKTLRIIYKFLTFLSIFCLHKQLKLTQKRKIIPIEFIS